MTDDPSGGSELENRYRAVFENMSEGFVVCEAILGPDGRLVDYWIREANPVFCSRVAGAEAVIGRRQLEVRPGTDERWIAACGRALTGKPVRFEFWDAEGGRWYDVHMMRLSNKQFGQFFIDVTARHRAAERQAELFLDLNHRVKNNLAIAASLLALQAKSERPEVAEALSKAVDRISSISELHTMLYQQEAHDSIQLKPYLSGLVERLASSLLDGDRVGIQLECEPSEVTAEDAVSFGLIVNELVTNAVKHAFPAGRQGSVTVTARRGPSGFLLQVGDDGCGMTGSADEGLGLRMVKSLATNLGAIDWTTGSSGTLVELRCSRHSAPDKPPG